MAMKRLQIMIDEELDEALEREARREHVSKAALIRRYVRKHLKPAIRGEDPLRGMAGLDEGWPGASTSLDDVVYPR